MASIILIIGEDTASMYTIENDKRTIVVGCTIGDNEFRSCDYKGHMMTVDRSKIWVRIPNDDSRAFCFKINDIGTHTLQ